MSILKAVLGLAHSRCSLVARHFPLSYPAKLSFEQVLKSCSLSKVMYWDSSNRDSWLWVFLLLSTVLQRARPWSHLLKINIRSCCFLVYNPSYFYLSLHMEWNPSPLSCSTDPFVVWPLPASLIPYPNQPDCHLCPNTHTTSLVLNCQQAHASVTWDLVFPQSGLPPLPLGMAGSCSFFKSQLLPFPGRCWDGI